MYFLFCRGALEDSAQFQDRVERLGWWCGADSLLHIFQQFFISRDINKIQCEVISIDVGKSVGLLRFDCFLQVTDRLVLGDIDYKRNFFAKCKAEYLI